MECSTEKDDFFVYETISYRCNLKNLGNIVLENLAVCLDENCKTTNLGIGQTDSVDFEKKYEEVGEKELLVSAKNDLVTRYDNEYIKIKDEAKIEIVDINHPQDVRYSEEFEISFLVERKSQSIPESVNIKISSSGFSKEWFLNAMDANQKFIVKVKGNNLEEGTNEVRIHVDYKDELGKETVLDKTFHIKLVNTTFFQKIMIKLFSFENWLKGLF